ncbi:MAG: hypothetical protein GTN38_03260 [Candidatus Aenigmarchaeota archaeon]|nr:hypothetical protein [Candidatus Aenigmarchaeota archaeon]NIP40680.1 hypothetical protein [Candidatus Aenigmarchaeota archaeon]NIQ18486.1 hypothetical protein [Candidatus Aenigmarchaeota archaeon]NIS73385.1 hypothetical protein [Candidatus Aenigmarchaeota archaeon]
MKLVIFLGLIIVFISCFFIFFTFHTLLGVKMSCEYGIGSNIFSCNVEELNFSVVFGILVVGLFLFVDTLVVYLMIKTWAPDLFMYRLSRSR